MADSSYVPAAPARGKGLPLLAVAALGAALGCTQIAALDLPLAIANGSRVLGGAPVPRTNDWVWPFPGYPCVHDKWGFDLLVAATDRAFGTAGLQSLQIAFGAALAALLFALARRETTPWRAAGLAALGVTMTSFRLFLRAEWISYLGAGAALWLLPGIVAKRRAHEIAFLAMVPVWAACHLYWFLGPIVVLVAAAAVRSARTALVGAAGVLAAAVSPFGFENVLHPARVTLQLEGTELRSALVEMRNPFATDTPWSFFHVLALVLALWGAAAVVAFVRAKRWRDAVLVLVWLALSLPIERNIAMLGIVVPLLAAAPLGAFVAQAAPWTGLAGPVAAACVAFGVPSFLAGRLPGFGWEDDMFPRALVAKLPESSRRERYVNDFSIGSFLDAARGGSFIDGNTHGYPPDFYALYLRARTGDVTVAEIDARWPNDGWMLRHNRNTTRDFVLGLFLDGDYAPVAWDGVATLFQKTSAPEEADAAWRRWLAEAYLPAARDWYPDDATVAAAAGAGPGAAQRAVVMNPWSPKRYLELAHEYERAGDGVRAGRCLRWASRLPQ
jgi:hypothetical protein